MRNALIVHDDMMLSRVAHRIEELTQSIELLESILNGTCKRPEYTNVNKKQVADRLEVERWELADLLEDIEEGLFVRELNAIHKKYVLGGEKK